MEIIEVQSYTIKKPLNQNKMKVNELRIGNLIIESLSFGSDKIIKVNSNIFNRRSDEFIPIPLTKEWLLKLGVLYNEFEDLFQIGGHDIDIQDSYYCHFYFNEYGEWYKEIKYVHQLQNLYFAIKGEELTFKSE